MIRQLVLRNFRKFAELTLGGDEAPLRPINILTGDNNSGKTSVLEALFVNAAYASPNRLEALNIFRGGSVATTDVKLRYGWLARQQNLATPVEIEATTDSGTVELSRIQFHDLSQLAISALQGDHNVPGSIRAAFEPRAAITMNHDVDGEQAAYGQFLLADNKLVERFESKTATPVSVYLPTLFRRTEDDVVEFSRLQEERRDGELVASLQEGFHVKRLVIGSPAGRPMLFVDTGTGPLQPVHLMGDGFRRILSLGLAISQSAGQRVMIDEFETGIHHSNLVATWGRVAKLARQLKVQLFVTTHSWECLVAAQEALVDEFAEDVAYFRLESDDDGDFAVELSFETLGAALSRRLEIR